jgi:hypothetical protein
VKTAEYDVEVAECAFQLETRFALLVVCHSLDSDIAKDPHTFEWRFVAVVVGENPAETNPRKQSLGFAVSAADARIDHNHHHCVAQAEPNLNRAADGSVIQQSTDLDRLGESQYDGDEVDSSQMSHADSRIDADNHAQMPEHAYYADSLIAVLERCGGRCPAASKNFEQADFFPAEAEAAVAKGTLGVPRNFEKIGQSLHRVLVAELFLHFDWVSAPSLDLESLLCSAEEMLERWDVSACSAEEMLERWYISAEWGHKSCCCAAGGQESGYFGSEEGQTKLEHLLVDIRDGKA